MQLRRKAIIQAAENYADAQKRLQVYLDARPQGSSDAWPETFVDEFDKKLHEVELAKEILLRMAGKL